MNTLDARGMACPMPLMAARRRMAELSPGETLLVLATDPEAPIDLAAWAAEEGHEFRVVGRVPGNETWEGGWLEFELRRRA